jgi:hypothetical protein
MLTTLEKTSNLYDIAEYMQDEDLMNALEFVAKVISKPDVPPSVASAEIVRLQAIAMTYALKASWYTNVDKTDRARKNLCYTLSEQLTTFVAALKYVMR